MFWYNNFTGNSENSGFIEPLSNFHEPGIRFDFWGFASGSHVKLENERIISTPIAWYEPLKNATLSQLKDYKLICMDTGIEWEALDYHLNIESMLFQSQNVAA